MGSPLIRVLRSTGPERDLDGSDGLCARWGDRGFEHPARLHHASYYLGRVHYSPRAEMAWVISQGVREQDIHRRRRRDSG